MSFAVAAWVSSPTSTPSGGAAACSLAAMLTASPITVSSRRPSGPTLAKSISPVFTPTRTQRPRKSSALSDARRWISRPVRTARAASSSCATGAPNTAISASPMTLSTDPPNCSTTSPIVRMQRSTIERTSSGSVRSEYSVKPEMSAKSTVAQRRSSLGCVDAAVAGVPVPSSAPHAPQNRKLEAISSPQAGQRCRRRAPQPPQNRCAAPFCSPQSGHRAMTVKLASLCGGQYVLVHAEEVLRIVTGLNLSEPRVVASVSGLDSILALSLAEEVDVRAARRERMERLPVGDCPGLDDLGVGRIGVDADDHLRPVRVPVRPRRIAIADATGGPVDGIQMHRGVHCGQGRTVLHMLLDRLVAELLDEVCAPVPLVPRLIEPVEGRLKRRIR